MMRISCPLALILLCASLCLAQENSERDPGIRMQALLDAFIASDQFQGTIVVDIQGQTVLEQSFGMADIDKHNPNTPETQFSIASLTKPFTTVLALQLVEAGKLAPVIDRVYRLSEVPEALRYFGERHHKGKIAIGLKD